MRKGDELLGQIENLNVHEAALPVDVAQAVKVFEGLVYVVPPAALPIDGHEAHGRVMNAQDVLIVPLREMFEEDAA